MQWPKFLFCLLNFASIILLITVGKVTFIVTLSVKFHTEGSAL
jgi:hypothetical protein